MSNFVVTCPHCLTERANMRVIGINAFPLEYSRQHKDDFPVSLGAVCETCFYPVAALVVPTSSPGSWNQHVDNVAKLTSQHPIAICGFGIHSLWPEIKDAGAPQHCPPTVERIFKQARAAQARRERDSAAMAFGKALDVAISVFAPDMIGRLVLRIDQLAQEHRITPEMRNWAHEVRLIRNEGAHEDQEPTSEDIEAIASFTETLLEYLFTLPAQVAERTARRIGAT